MFDEQQQRSQAPKLPVGAYVPPFLKTKANDIESWVSGKNEPRALIAVLLRKLIHTTGQELTLVDFPGYDQAERKGWDGRVDANAATSWIPIGQSGWEFGCNEDLTCSPKTLPAIIEDSPARRRRGVLKREEDAA